MATSSVTREARGEAVQCVQSLLGKNKNKNRREEVKKHLEVSLQGASINVLRSQARARGLEVGGG
eukprot:9309694-Karenia_brevis.AAC.1